MLTVPTNFELEEITNIYIYKSNKKFSQASSAHMYHIEEEQVVMSLLTSPWTKRLLLYIVFRHKFLKRAYLGKSTRQNVYLPEAKQ